ncbi:phage tail protein [Aliarcobacter butzleri]|uniref:phage tail protein n=1 Tax=Aliarcobacter butzleri TaxID=28197 RepID=UPI002B249C17|nr:phage tail protein [Aliarcobacter butzleri]
MENFYTLLSNTGINAIIAARASNSEVKLTKIAVGDGDIIPSQDMTALKSEKHRFNINSIIQDIDNPNYLIVEGVIPSNVGGFYVSEVAIYTDQNILFAIGSLPKTYKPLLEEGSAKDLTIKIFLEITNVDSVTLKVDDSVVLATRKFVLSELKKYALINGDETKRFKVADAVANNEAINKKQLELSKASLEELINKNTLQPVFAGVATLTGGDNKIVMTGIVSTLSLEKGDVIQFVAGANAQNSRERTVESIINDNEIIVNYEHCGSRGNGSLKLSDETSITCTVKRVAKWFNCSNTLGRAPIPLPHATYMPIGSILQNTTGRDMLLSSALAGNGNATQYSFNQITWYDAMKINNNTTGETIMAIIPRDAYYRNTGSYYTANIPNIIPVR